MPETRHEGDPSIAGQEAIDLLRQISDHAEDVIFILDEDRSIRFTSGDLRTHGGVSLSGGSLAGLPDVYQALKGPAEKVFRFGKPLSVECVLGEPGHETWLHTRLTPITGESGKVSSVLGIARDITDLKRKEKLIADSRGEWLQAIDTMPFLMAVVDSDFRIRKANMALADLLGVSLQDLHGNICYRTFGKERVPELCPLLRPKKAGQGPVEFQSNISGRPFLVTASPLTDGSGITTGCLFLAWDLHGHRDEIAEVRKKNAEELKLVLSRAEYLLFVQDENGTFLSISALPGNIRLPEAVVGKTPFDFFETPAARRMCERIRKMMKDGSEHTVQTLVKLGGETFHLLSHISLIRDTAGNPISVLTMSKNITDSREELNGFPEETPELTKREHEVLLLIGSGLTTSQIAEKLFISGKTVETHRSRIMQKLGVHKSSALATYAVKSGFL
jgi:PAS domain S-box-containing protein